MLPNPYDVGTAVYLKHLGFKALASTSAGFAFSRGLPDHAVTRDMVLAHLREIVAATDLPVNADYEAGYAVTLDDLSHSVRLCVETGVAGLSIEDSTNVKSKSPLYDLKDAVERMHAARAAIDATGQDVMLIGRAECFLVGHEDALNESIRRLTAYAEAGADCLYAPGVRKREDIEALVKAVAPKPFNLLVGMASPLRLDDYAAMGVRRISVGGALAGAAWGAFGRAARHLAEGRFDGFAENEKNPLLNSVFSEAAKGS
ncbi:MAG: isocitrate lyase/phosphoenolpyruvate mutase family protein [Beijerinckiaceae bacterium]